MFEIETSTKLIQEDILKTDSAIEAIIQDIKACPNSEDLSKLNSQAWGHIKKMKKQTEDLKLMATQKPKSANLQFEAGQYSKQMLKKQAILKEAILQRHLYLDKKSRQELMSTGKPRQRVKPTNIAATATNITDNLLSVSRSMASQLTLSANTLETLTTSSSVMQGTSEELKGMGSTIQTSSKIVTKFNRREFTDKVMLFLAFAFFFACVLYVVKKRIF